MSVKCRVDFGNVRAQYLDIPWKVTEPKRQSPDKTPTSTANLAVPANDSLSGALPLIANLFIWIFDLGLQVMLILEKEWRST